MPCMCAAAGAAQGPCSSVVFSQVPEGAFRACVASGKGSGTGAGCCSSQNVQLDVTAAPAARLGWARAPGLALDLCESNDLAYQAEGVLALKCVQNMIIRNFTSATCRRFISFSTPAQVLEQ